MMRESARRSHAMSTGPVRRCTGTIAFPAHSIEDRRFVSIDHLDAVSQRIDPIPVVSLIDADDVTDPETAQRVPTAARIPKHSRESALADHVVGGAMVKIRVAENQDAVFRPHVFP